MLRCNDCSRPVAARWPRCRWCRAVRHRPYGTEVAILDAWLDTLRNFGASLSLPLAGAAVGLYLDDQPLSAALLGLYAVLMLVSHLLLPWFALSWHVAQGLWGLGVLTSLGFITMGLAETAVFAALPVMVSVAMLKWRAPLLARLAGSTPEPKQAPRRPSRWGGCEVCGESNARVVAPVWCVSMLVVTTRWTGEFHRLCGHHALLRALPATLCSALVGWWGIPWGMFWTPLALYQNVVEGGVEEDPNQYDARVSADPLHGRWESYLPPMAMALGLLGIPFGLLVVMSKLGH
ncbi:MULTISPECIES: hypothetical protein [Myxococcus]|uniref:Uncharacterized protein n=1 Tax=Myxococcus llanfairpwllgwyngyllgogerychwyrndrobwllllantysiliogogogochensis TaxID=2590453 RepID=A0A540XA85_9BACT|nr:MULTISPECIES: hypothetical protein [Myxococcus]NTX04533.1 hypothetical protein [Myxococcus sp. CA040A]NTX35887.1 hypothetical protein [Myxococcus sp. CA033]TQF18048.1 hypothetical protein FJV41_00440 [Myxococcus llanfairpwllgwyngyllgogerychwyrndrobwllllantysiliogogogochensis]